MFLNCIYIIMSIKDIFPADDHSEAKMKLHIFMMSELFALIRRVFPTESSREHQASGQRFLETIGRRFALHETHKKYFFRLVVQGKRPCLKFVFFSYINTEFRTTRRLVYA